MLAPGVMSGAATLGTTGYVAVPTIIPHLTMPWPPRIRHPVPSSTTRSIVFVVILPEAAAKKRRRRRVDELNRRMDCALRGMFGLDNEHDLPDMARQYRRLRAGQYRCRIDEDD